MLDNGRHFSPGTPLGHIVSGTFCPLGHVVPWDIWSVGRFVLGVLSWDVLSVQPYFAM